VEKVAHSHRPYRIVFQSYNLFPHLTIEQNITLAPCSVKRMSLTEAKALAHKVLAQVGLEEKIHAYPEQLSDGQQQRAAIARSLDHYLVSHARPWRRTGSRHCGQS
jgi:ABC-type polar amino acid transport system ATPase subunit